MPFEIRYNNVYQTFLRYLFFITNGVAISANSADYVYYRFLNKRATADIFVTFENEQHLPKMIFRFLIDYWPATLFCLLLLVLMIWLYEKVKTRKPEPVNKVSYWIVNILMIPVVLVLIVGAARGGYKHSTRPITISNAARYVNNPHDVAIVLNTPFSLLRTLNKKELIKYAFFSEEEAEKLYNPHYVQIDSGK
jgi:NADH:ubiquinone oxidoreductase subunit 5 (subunit L)/multisubunit Na+/H+ antiporter MnhA subunit